MYCGGVVVPDGVTSLHHMAFERVRDGQGTTYMSDLHVSFLRPVVSDPLILW